MPVSGCRTSIRQLEKHGLFFPIDLGADPRAGRHAGHQHRRIALPANMATCAATRWASTVVLADAEGTVLDLTSELRKNNTGIDWKQVFIGTSGSLSASSPNAS